MNLIKSIFSILIFISIIFGVSNAATFYTTFHSNFQLNTPNSLFVSGAKCLDNSCSNVDTTNEVQLFNGKLALSCWSQVQNNGNIVQFNSCMANAKVNSSIINLANTNNYIVTKENVPSTFGYLTYFSANNDSYLVKANRQTNIQCNYNICFQSNPIELNFQKAPNAIAQIEQLNIKNTNNINKPIQVTVPVNISNTVCSAFRFTNPNQWRPQIPRGYSDYSANTKISLNITNNKTGLNYLSQSIVLPIQADNCAGITAFNWTPNLDLNNTVVNFTVTTKVIDNQVLSTTKDSATDIETIYPLNLSNTCWARVYNFTLSNVNSFKLNSSVSNIIKGESLYALFLSNAFETNITNPISYNAKILMNGISIYSKDFTKSSNYRQTSVNLTNIIKNLDSGTYETKLIVTPNNLNCQILTPIIKIQQLQIENKTFYTTHFHINYQNGSYVHSGLINLYLTKSGNNYVNPPKYNQTLNINSSGEVQFQNIPLGDYNYIISNVSDSNGNVYGKLHIASDMQVYVTLNNFNSPPIVNLPKNYTSYYKNPILINLQNYIVDYNDGFSNLKITFQKLSGNAIYSYITPNLKISSNDIIGLSRIKITATDKSGASMSEIVTFNFINATFPQILFNVTPTNGQVPLKTMFTYKIITTNFKLKCDLNFGDGTSTQFSCSKFDVYASNISHTYNSIGTYTAKLKVTDKYNNSITKQVNIYVYNKKPTPIIIKSFNLTSSNGNFIPTNLTFKWNIINPDNLTLSMCYLTIGNSIYFVNCTSNNYSYLNYLTKGSSKFIFNVIDSKNNHIQKTIIKTFYGQIAKLKNIQVQLNLNSNQNFGVFNFNLSVLNESIRQRVTSIIPIIKCLGTTNRITSQTEKLTESLLTSKFKKNRNIKFSLNTNSFNLNILKNTSCKFELILKDNIGSFLNISKPIIFNYPIITQKYTSIRGNANDITNYISSKLLNGINTGYNTLSFVVQNNNKKSTSISTTLISSKLNLYIQRNIFVLANSKVIVNLPIYVTENIKKGLYPLRLSINYNDQKQTIYSYVRIN